MASAGDTTSSSSKKKSKKKSRNSNPIVTTGNTISYGPPPPAVQQFPPGAQPGYPAVAGYPGQPVMFMAPGTYPGTYPATLVPATGQMPPGTILQQPLPQPPTPTPSPAAGQQQRQLDFEQAMSDFMGMFPKLDRVVIETVLRSNSGKVDETIDQLLKLNVDILEVQHPTHPMPTPSSQPFPPSQRPAGLFDGMSGEPPPYTPPEPDSPFSRYNSSASSNTITSTTSPLTRQNMAPPVPAPRESNYSTTIPQLPPSRRPHSVSGEESTANRSTSRQWNPPIVGNLPTDFLRLSVSGDSPSMTPAPTPTPTASQGVPERRTSRGIQRKLEENTTRRQSIDQNDQNSAQMIEDERIALMLQNEEFLRQLQRDPEFMSALERDYHAALHDDSSASNNTASPTPTTRTTTPRTTTSPTPPPRPSLPPSRPSQPPPGMAHRPLPSTPGPELPARPPSMGRESSGSSLTNGMPTGISGSSSSSSSGAVAGGGLSYEDIEFQNKLNHMGKTSKTKLSLLAGRFQKKKKASKKYETGGDGGAIDPLLGESIYEELNEDSLLHRTTENSADDNPYHQYLTRLDVGDTDTTC